MVRERCALWSLWPLAVSPLERRFPQQFCSVLRGSCRTWILPFSLLGSYSHLLDRYCLSLVGSSSICLMPSLWSPHGHFLPPAIVHPCSCYTQDPLQSNHPPPWPKASSPPSGSHPQTLPECGLTIVVVISPPCFFSALPGIITLSSGELYLFFYLLHSFRKCQVRLTIQVLWPLLDSLERKLLGIRGTYNLVWVWKGIEWKADTQTSLSNSESH